MNNYCYKLNLPVSVAFGINQLISQTKTSETLVILENSNDNLYMRNESAFDENNNFLKWLDSLNLQLISSGYFYIAANSFVDPHIDGHEFNDFCKINWKFGPPGSVVNWYEPLQDCKLCYHDHSPQDYAIVNSSKIKKVFSIEHPDVCLFNPGRIHSFESGRHAQHIISGVLGTKKTKKPLPWYIGQKLFSNFIA